MKFFVIVVMMFATFDDAIIADQLSTCLTVKFQFLLRMLKTVFNNIP